MKVYTGGTFDLFHAGHLSFLEKCSLFGEVWVALNTDEFIAAYKGNPPVMTLEERMAVLLGCRYVQGVIVNSGGRDSKPCILEVKPDLIAIGSDWARRDYYQQMSFDQDFLDEHNISLVYIPYTVGISSTDIKLRMKNAKLN